MLTPEQIDSIYAECKNQSVSVTSMMNLHAEDFEEQHLNIFVNSDGDAVVAVKMCGVIGLSFRNKP